MKTNPIKVLVMFLAFIATVVTFSLMFNI
jgi:hypothetical protein